MVIRMFEDREDLYAVGAIIVGIIILIYPALVAYIIGLFLIIYVELMLIK